VTDDLIYLDHAATSWPKPDVVREAMGGYFAAAGGNPGRSGHRMSIAASRAVEEARDAVAALLGVHDPGRVVFTKNATEALNTAILGLVGPGDHVVTSSIEHNSVMRPLRHLESLGCRLTVVECNADGTMDASAIDAAIEEDTRLVVTLHGSNVMGSLLPIADIGAIARRRGVPYLVDASQTAGSIPIDLSHVPVDLLAFTGHKALLGPTGTGGLVVGSEVEVPPLTRGGTGSRSDLEYQPEFLPDALESGTLNMMGLLGLTAGTKYLAEVGVATVAAHERTLVAHLRSGLEGLPGVHVQGPGDPDLRCGVVSFTIDTLASSDVGTILDRDYSIMSRVGLHCSPGAHRTQGTFPGGTVRFGLGFSNSASDVDTAIDAVTDIAEWAAKR
jgi:cysteine desulfurase/selenocysteine lyase